MIKCGFYAAQIQVSVLWQVRLSTYCLMNVAAALRGNALDTSSGFCSTRLTGSDVMSSTGAIFINLQGCRDLNVPAQQLVDCDWLTKPLLSRPDERWESENKCAVYCWVQASLPTLQPPTLWPPLLSLALPRSLWKLQEVRTEWDALQLKLWVEQEIGVNL